MHIRTVETKPNLRSYHTALWALRSQEVGSQGLCALVFQTRIELSKPISFLMSLPVLWFILWCSLGECVLDSFVLNWSWRWAHPMHPPANERSAHGDRLELVQRNQPPPKKCIVCVLSYLATLFDNVNLSIFVFKIHSLVKSFHWNKSEKQILCILSAWRCLWRAWLK